MTDHHPTNPILDVRNRTDFERGHHYGAVNIPLEELADRTSELPPPDIQMLVADGELARIDRALAILSKSGRVGKCLLVELATMNAEQIVTGPSSDYLWQPHSLVERAIGYMECAWGGIDNQVALDLAAGVGRDAARLALAGLEVHAWDLLPDALERAEQLATNVGAQVATKVVDLEQPSCNLGRDQFDAIACFHYLHRPMMGQIVAAIRPGGFVVYETFTVEQRSRIGKPRRDKFLLRPGELSSYFAGWNVWWNSEGCSNGRWVASLIAQRP